jgi:predicted 2-oxoglutarate/Fe(II)-dependent dioxygenase YbiX
VVPPTLLAQFGMFVNEGFLDRDLCDRLAAEMREVQAHPATVRVRVDGALRDEVREQHRRAQVVDVSEATVNLIKNRLREAKPVIEEHFSETLTTIQPPRFIVYREGDFFRPHRDNGNDRGVGDDVTQRRISVVLFVNSRPGGYAGGALTFYGLLGTVGIPLTETPGLLVAFRSGTLHGVDPVTSGQRCTIVSWMA